MDNLTEPTSAKKRCITRNENKMQLVECVRKFRLPQQFPSTLKQAMKQGIVNSMGSSPSILMPENTITSLSGVKFQIPSKLQKLRILSPNGKDLGEFNVELRTDNPLKGKTITLRSVKKSSLSPVLHSKIFPRILKQGTAKISKNNSIKSCSRSDSKEVNKNNASQKSTTLRINKIIGKEEDIETRNKEVQACNSDINEIPVSLSETNCKQSLYQTIDSNNQKHIVCNGINNVNNCIKIPKITITEVNEITSAARVSPHEEIIESTFPITNLKLAVNSSDNNNVHKSKEYFKVSSGKCFTSVKNTENVKIVTSLKNAVNFAQHNQINSNLIENSLDSNGKENVNNPKVINNRNKLFQVNSDVFLNNQAYKTMQKNIMTVIPNNETFLFNQNTISTQEYNIAISPAREKNIINVHHGKVLRDTKSDNIQSKLVLKEDPRNNSSSVLVNNPVQCVQESQPITNTIDTIVQLDVQNKNYPINSTQSDLSDQWNIIKKAMNSVKDNKLRVLALKALADCGIGIERHVPIRLPEEHKAVHDTQVQTMVFGLLDTSFIFINKDLDSIQRIKQISLYDVPSNQDQLLTNDLNHSNDFLYKAPLINEQENDFDIDSFIKQIFEENSDTLKMKETLSATKIRCKNLIEHLERDFELVKRYDQNGMLNIHNAVISNNIHLVQRQLMILEQCKESVDILTEDGTVSLI